MGLKFRLVNSTTEGGTVTEKQAFEFMHQYERNEASGIESVSHFCDDVILQGGLHAFGFFGSRSEGGGLYSSRPSGRQTVIVDHGCCDAVWIFIQVVCDVLLCRWPGFDPSTILTLSCIAYQFWRDGVVAAGNQVVS